ncbi:hypothetical protein [Pseudonocardia sp. KRD291]|uniref:hypothetical protein n=1 Tax=Pseudonocardia sp. KRD291 TaxID=2792007 RepID=UPI001C4A19E9|nr:hypothetical protein [Pseudonocardia sp. KRD291]MBW0103553.1 hypothetical protein [Pseudonocardia sp. KRD291]
MDTQYTGAGVPAARPGLSPGAAVLLWIFVGWPLSWILLFAFVPLGILFGIGITIWMIVIVSSGGHRGPPVVVNVGQMATAPLSAAASRHHAIRQEVESLASVNAVGGCGWCGSPSAHVNDLGYLVHPRHWHAAEIVERIRSTTRD